MTDTYTYLPKKPDIMAHKIVPERVGMKPYLTEFMAELCDTGRYHNHKHPHERRLLGADLHVFTKNMIPVYVSQDCKRDQISMYCISMFMELDKRYGVKIQDFLTNIATDRNDTSGIMVVQGEILAFVKMPGMFMFVENSKTVRSEFWKAMERSYSFMSEVISLCVYKGNSFVLITAAHDSESVWRREHMCPSLLWENYEHWTSSNLKRTPPQEVFTMESCGTPWL